MARRVGYVEAFKKKFKQTPVVQVEAGNFLQRGMNAAALLKNEQILQALSRWPADVVNLGRFDIAHAPRLLAREGLAKRVAEFPMLKSIISANAMFDAGVVAPPPYVIKVVTGPRIPLRNKTVRIGFLGLSEPRKLAEGEVKDMYKTARQFVPELRKKCDLLVIIAHADYDPAVKLAAENPEADVVIAADASVTAPPPMTGKPVIVPASAGNVQQADLRIYFDKDSRAAFKFRLTDLDAQVPSDPAVAAFIEAAGKEKGMAKPRGQMQ